MIANKKKLKFARMQQMQKEQEQQQQNAADDGGAINLNTCDLGASPSIGPRDRKAGRLSPL